MEFITVQEGKKGSGLNSQIAKNLRGNHTRLKKKGKKVDIIYSLGWRKQTYLILSLTHIHAQEFTEEYFKSC